MDSNSFSIFGPYANKFKPKNQNNDVRPSSTLKSVTRSQRKPIQQAQPPPASIKKALFTSSSAAAGQSTRAALPKTAPDWTAFHKKPSSNFALSTQSKLSSRMNKAEERRKQNRTEIVTGNRKIDVTSLSLVTPAPEKTVAMSETAPVVPEKESRKEQLMRWKREKEEMAKSGPQKKPPFKSGPAQPVTAPAASAAFRHQKQTVTVAPKQHQQQQPEERRVTRAMAKAQTIPLAPHSTLNNANALDTTKSKAPSRLKTANKANTNIKITANGGITSENEKPKPKTGELGKAKALTAVAPMESSSKSEEEPEPMIVDDHEEKSNSTSLGIGSHSHEKADVAENKTAATINSGKGEPGTSESGPVTNGNGEPPAKPKVRKPKGMQFDSAYVEYNDKFVKACSSLVACSTKWSELFANRRAEIPEEICCDIESSLGQAKLLLESKLPQFGELLYFYLSKHQDPSPILPCDLQGWWDVAVISVDKVLKRFDDLTELEKKGWVGEEVKPDEKEKSARGSGTSQAKPKGSGSGGPKSNAKANSGLMAFLAEKRRKAAAAAAGKEEPLTENGATGSTIPKSPSPDRKFEGGFFAIRSPASVKTPKHETPAQAQERTPRGTRNSLSGLSSSFQARLQVTPGSSSASAIGLASRRLSNPKTPLFMLAVRKSMGPICKIGVDGAPLKEQPERSAEGFSPAFKSFPEEAPM